MATAVHVVYDDSAFTGYKPSAAYKPPEVPIGAPTPYKSFSTGGWSDADFFLFNYGTGLKNETDVELIPDWAAILVAVGAPVALGGFVAACFTTSGLATLVLTAGLLLLAGGIAGAEEVIADRD